MPPVLELKGITKRFPGILANDHIDLRLEKGEILALLGENGAGKSTLMNILYGLYQPDEGSFFVNGQPVEIHGPMDAIHAGIGMVHQHFMLIPVFSVTENVMLGEESVRMGGILDKQSAAARITEIADTYGLSLDPKALVRDLPVGIQQRVEIVKLLYRNANILIFDEPTAVLTPQEADDLFRVMKSLTDQGKSIIFITHKLREVLEYSDRIMVIRRGKVVGETIPADSDQASLAAMMVGRSVNIESEKAPCKPGAPVLSVNELYVSDNTRTVTVHGISFEIREGEILGIAGVQGNGQTELEEAVTGMRDPDSGTIEFVGKTHSKIRPRRFVEAGGAHIPEDRQRDGLILSFSIEDNMMLCTYYKQPFSVHGVFDRKVIAENALELIERFDVRPPHPLNASGNLSGGNQQKVIVARELSRDDKLIVASQPTRGLDIGSIEYIHGQLVKKRDEGCAVLLISSELDEIMALSDRILVMYKGRAMCLVNRDETTKEKIGLYMAGVQDGGESANQEASK